SLVFGGSGADYGKAIALDADGNVYVTGKTAYGGTGPNNFAATQGTFESYPPGSIDAFVAKFNSSGTVLEYCTYLGGARQDEAYGIAVDRQGCAFVTGLTEFI